MKFRQSLMKYAEKYGVSRASLYRVMKKYGMLPQKKEKKKRIVKPYEQMTHAGERVQIDVKVVPLYQKSKQSL